MGGVPGAASGALTLTTAPALSNGILELVLGAANGPFPPWFYRPAVRSTGFGATQSLTLDNIQAGNYDNVITNVASGIDATQLVSDQWRGYTISFTDDGSNIDLTVSVPEPSTVAAGLLFAGAFGWRQAPVNARLVVG